MENFSKPQWKEDAERLAVAADGKGFSMDTNWTYSRCFAEMTLELRAIRKLAERARFGCAVLTGIGALSAAVQLALHFIH